MSWSFSVPTGPAAEFTQRAQEAKASLEARLEGQDYALDQLASGQADKAIETAQTLLGSGVLGDVSAGVVDASLHGHAATEAAIAGGASAHSSIGITVSFSPEAQQSPAGPVATPAEVSVDEPPVYPADPGAAPASPASPEAAPGTTNTDAPAE